MPTYVYKCRQCKRTSEVFQKITADPLTECSECHTQTLHRVPSGGLFKLQGAGWYATDYAAPSATTPSPSPDTDTATPACCPCGKNSDSCNT